MNRRNMLYLAGGLGASAVIAVLALRRSTPVTRTVVVLPRASWNASAPDHAASNESGWYDAQGNPAGWLVYPPPLEQRLTTVVVHHTALPLSDGPQQIQAIHMQQHGYADIGYHFVIDASGQVYEGRTINVRGAHTRAHNTGTVGIALMGNFVDHAPPAAQHDALTALVSQLRDRYHITHLASHRDFLPGETVCPGDHLAKNLTALAYETGLHYGTGGYRVISYPS